MSREAIAEPRNGERFAYAPLKFNHKKLKSNNNNKVEKTNYWLVSRIEFKINFFYFGAKESTKINERLAE